jgi:glycosyltransferase involved in cell wall biosynthesis
MGHDVTLFASGDSVTRAQLVPACERALRLDEQCHDGLAAHFRMLGQVAERAAQFDLIHFHIDYLHFPVTQWQPWPHVTTLHGRLDLPELNPLHRQYAGQPLVSISNSQRRPLAFANWVTTVYHGLPHDLHRYRKGPGRYLAFLGRISPEKGLDRAIAIARRTGMKLLVAAKVDKADAEYYSQEIRPLLQDSRNHVEFIGEVGEREKDDLLGNARALLVPIDWPEPFGLVMIEALACGTPVIAFRRGSVPEVIDNGVTGFVVETEDEAVRAVGRLAELRREVCRQTFEQRFTARRMANDYAKVYERILAGAK